MVDKDFDFVTKLIFDLEELFFCCVKSCRSYEGRKRAWSNAFVQISMYDNKALIPVRTRDITIEYNQRINRLVTCNYFHSIQKK